MSESNHNKKTKSTNKFRSIHSKIVNAMLGYNGRFPAFNSKLHRWVDHEGNSQVYLEDDRGVVKYIADDHIHALIAEYWDTCLDSGSDEYWGEYAAEDGVKIRKLWLAKAPAVTRKWRPLGWNSTADLCLHKVHLDPMSLSYQNLESLCPAFWEFMSRFENHKTFMAYIGSLFCPDSQRQQYAWIFGSGGNGKSAIIRALSAMLGPVASYEQPPTQGAKHWTIGLRNKRLVVFADCNNASFVTTGEFKSLTGEDGVRMEPKGKPSFTDDIHAKFLFSSNSKPKISSTDADMRRILFFDSGKITKDFGPSYESMLLSEMKWFLPICYAVYLEETKGDPRAMLKLTNNDELLAAASASEIEYETFCTEYIQKVQSEDGASITSRKNVKLRRMYELMELAGFKSKYERDKLRDYMARVHGITDKVVKSDGKSIRVYVDCAECLK